MIVKKMKTFLEVEGKMGPDPNLLAADMGPLSQTLILMSEKTRHQKREKE